MFSIGGVEYGMEKKKIPCLVGAGSGFVFAGGKGAALWQLFHGADDEFFRFAIERDDLPRGARYIANKHHMHG